MPSIRVETSVDVDIDDIIDQIDDDYLIEEVLSRNLRINQEASVSGDEAISALDESAMILRKQGRADLAFRLDEIRKGQIDAQ